MSNVVDEAIMFLAVQVHLGALTENKALELLLNMNNTADSRTAEQVTNIVIIIERLKRRYITATGQADGEL